MRVETVGVSPGPVPGPSPSVALLVLDGDDTLWHRLDGVACSECSLSDRVGSNELEFAPAPGDPDLAIRTDGARFRLAPGARAVLARCRAAGVRLALASFNHPAPAVRLLAAFGLLPLFSHVVATWSPDKAAILRRLLAAEHAAGRTLAPSAVLFVDDDPEGRYRPMAAAVGVRFAQMGAPGDVASFADIARLVGLDEGSAIGDDGQGTRDLA